MSTNDFNTPDPFVEDAGRVPRAPEFELPASNVPPHTTDPVASAPLSPRTDSPLVSPESPGATKAGDIADEARDLAHEGQDAARHVGDTARREAEHIVEDVKEEASHLFEELSTDVRAQAAIQQEKIAANLRDISQELRGMLNASPSHGSASSLVDQAAHHSGKIADWLEARDPGDLIQEVKGFARKRPGAFLGLALGAGLLAGRITRNAGGKPEDAAKPTPPRAAVPSPAGIARETTPMPPTYDDTLGSGAPGGSGTDPRIAYPPPAGSRTDQGYLGS
ncbi:hypothetical protein [Paeniglutamicibacter kerguelensis]|uniref:Vacuolar-type H+-ATPase subunit H n=1 Tax=Paeniglutamicibacter kerguelensis TaxID=254788 RepID=A0ABS4XCP4_9MICC|nr:hypothetical protein [Paeniglutamicibacter kerguelensis]MBP2386248.1 vacuolar-type H+-ATPase subunit H [Paeniglutamicibacter kerguelensis]